MKNWEINQILSEYLGYFVAPAEDWSCLEVCDQQGNLINYEYMPLDYDTYTLQEREEVLEDLFSWHELNWADNTVAALDAAFKLTPVGLYIEKIPSGRYVAGVSDTYYVSGEKEEGTLARAICLTILAYLDNNSIVPGDIV